MSDINEMEDFQLTARSIHTAMMNVSDWPKGSPFAIRWGDRVVRTSDRFEVRPKGRLKIEFLRRSHEFRQGMDVKVSEGLVLEDGSKIPVLRTWNDPEHEDILHYDYLSPDGKMSVWNVYEDSNPAGKKWAAKWGGNAGFWLEVDGDQRTYHCSAGPCDPPDFESLVFRLTLS